MSEPEKGQRIDVPLLSLADYVSDEYIAPFTITVAGSAGNGKTTLALSMASEMPVYFLETENRFAYLAKKMQKQLFDMPYPIHACTVTNWGDILIALGNIKRESANNDPKNRGVIVIDSGTDFKNFADHEWRTTSKTFPVTNWSKLYKMMNDIVSAIKKIGLSVVFTNRMKPKYEGETWDGVSYDVDSYKNQDYLSEAVLIIKDDATMLVQNNKWHDSTRVDADSKLINRDMTLPQIIKILQA